MTCGFLNQLKG